MNQSDPAQARYRPLYSDDVVIPRGLTPEPNPDASPRGRKKLACTSCRQAKIRCVGLRPGSKCERCRRRSTSCHVDSQYKRTAHPSKLQELSDEVEHLKGLLNTNSITTSLWRRGGEINGSGVVGHRITSVENGADLLQTSNTASASHAATEESPPEFTWTTHARALDGVTVEAAMISKLFETCFYRHFHPQLPLINERVPIDKYFDLSPLLFWTVIAIASRSGAAEADLALRLRDPLTQLLWSKISTIPVSHFTIQAILLLCTWPYSPVSLISDPSFMLISIAKAGCVQLGLHSPEHMQDYHRVRFNIQHEQVREAIMVWVCCFIASESVTSGEGRDPIIGPEDSVLVRAAESANTYSLPTTMHQILRCQVLVHQLRCTMIQTGYNIPDSPNSILSPVLKSAELRLEKLSTQLQHESKDTTQMTLQCAKVQMYILYLHEHPNASSRQHGLIKAFNASSELISLLDALSAQHSFCFAAPRYFSQNLKLSALLLLKLRFSTVSRLFDTSEIEQNYMRAVSAHKRLSIHDNDFDARAAIILTELWKIRLRDSDMQFKDPVLTLTSRGGASLLYESHWQWRDYYAATAQDHIHQNRPPRILPSIIMHTPGSQQSDNDGQQADIGSIHSPAIGPNGSVQADNNAVLGTNEAPGHTETYDLGNSYLLNNHSPLPGALDLMYAYLDPNEEASQLFYPPWTADVDGFV